MIGTMVRPPVSDDRIWVLKRLGLLAFLMYAWPVPFNLGQYGIIVPAGTWTMAYGIFEVAQAVIFGLLLFYSDAIPGLRTIRQYWNHPGLHPLVPFKKILRIVVEKMICLGILVYAILNTFDILQQAAPAGELRFCAATAYFIVSRVMTIPFLLLIDDNNDDPKQRRRRIAKAVVDRFRSALGRPAPAPALAPVTRCAGAPARAVGPALRPRA